MLKSFSLKFISLAMVLSISSSFAQAEDNVFATLPFGVVIGKTTNKEIEDKGVCQQKIKVSDNYFRCEKYNITAGNFDIYSSANELVQKINFGESSRTPKLWKEKGLYVGHEFKIITRSEVSNFLIGLTGDYEVERHYDHPTIKHSWYTVFSMEINGNHFEITMLFTNDAEDLGSYVITSIEITEAF